MFYSLRSRLMLAFSILLIIPFVALVYLLSEQSAKLIQQSIETSTSQTVDQFASHVSTLLTQVEDVGTQVMSNRVTQDWLTVHMNKDSRVGELLLAKQRLREYFSSYAVNNSNGISMSVFTDDAGGIWTQDRSYVDSKWYKQFKAEDRRWTEAHLDSDQADESMRTHTINSFILPLVQLQSLKTVGLVKINYDTSLLQGAIDKIRIGSTGKVFLLTANGSSVLNQDLGGQRGVLQSGLTQLNAQPKLDESGFFSIRQNREDYLLFYRKLPLQDWVILGEVPEGELYEQISRTRQTMLLVSFLLLLLVIAVAFWLSAGITKPLSAMAKAMRHVKNGEFERALKLMPKARSGHSEVGYVTGFFEQMVHRLKYLIQTEFEANLRRKNAEYKALLLQINPHFFNNSLEIISGLAALKRGDLVMDATEALGKMMRYSLNLHTDRVKVSEELDYIRDYLFILKLRHEDRLIVNMEEDPAADGLFISKFILQPLVENAVKYSLEKGAVAEVTIASRVEEERLLLSVKDNGIGMSPGLTADLMAETRQSDVTDILSSEGNSIGLRNVLSRCRLSYGSRFQLILNSEPDKGTEITLQLPLIRR
ncbi:cache domain-containing sensor histidine kinase [Paenibacillus beijingensis]|uniref:histidine kinase n=1 Tax=Paenibacillus beijingensis TaxID=1126833 RepID=A0A0D5NG33_9BACL|nr:sensor histidine kinase [Paenibacillus beijingensis]AJY73873.1 histidine kinase [Paenibacillus beijingensis]